MTVDRLVWDHFMTNEVNGDAEIISMTMVMKDEDGNLKYCGVNEYGSFYTE